MQGSWISVRLAYDLQKRLDGNELSPAELKVIMWLLEVEPEEEDQELEDLQVSIGEGH